MLQLSKLFLAFAPLLRENSSVHRGERLSFDPSENLENSKYKGEKSESCFSCSSMYSRTFRLRMSRRLTPLCAFIS